MTVNTSQMNVVEQMEIAEKAGTSLAEPDNLAMVTQVNRQIHQLAPVLNSPTVAEGGVAVFYADTVYGLGCTA